MAQNKPNKAHQKALSKKPKPAQKKAKQKSTSGEPLASGLYSFIEKWSLPLFFILLLATTGVVFKDFLSKKLIFLFSDIGSDSLNIYYPNFVLIDAFKNGDIPMSKWTHYVGMGNVNPMGQLSLWKQIVAFPLTAIFWVFGLIASVFGLNELPYSIGWTQYVNVLLTGTFGFLWLKSLNVKKTLALLGALSIALSGYVLLGSTWFHSGLNMIFFLFAFEQFFEKKRWYFLPIAFTLFASYQYWFATAFMMIYGLFRFFYNEEQPSAIRFSKFAGSVIGLCALGLVLNAPNIQDQFKNIVQSPRGEGMFGSDTVSNVSASYITKLSDQPVFGLEESIHYQSALLRTYDPDILGSGTNFTGWQNYLEAPAFSTSILFFLLLPLLFFVFKGKKRWAMGAFVGVWILIVLFPFFRYAFYFFVGDYYKQAMNYFIPFSIVVAGVLILSELLKGNTPKWYYAAGAGLLSLILLNVPFDTTGVLNQELKSTAQTFVVLYGVLVTLLCLPKFQKIAAVALLFIVPIELTSRGIRMLDARESISADFFESKRGYNDYSVEAIQFLNERDSSFFRVEKNYGSSPSIHASINDAQVQKYRGTQSYSSFNNIYYIRFLSKMGIIPEGNESLTRWAPGVRYLPLAHGPLNVKYTLMSPRFQLNPNTFQTLQSNGVSATVLQPVARYLNQNGQTIVMNQADFAFFVQSIIGQSNFNQYAQVVLNSANISNPDFRSAAYQQIGQVEDVLILENPNFLPLGTVYNRVIPESEMQGLQDIQMPMALYYAAIIPDDLSVGIPKLPTSEINPSVTYDNIKVLVEARKSTSVEWIKSNEAFTDLKGRVSLTEPGWLFMSFPYDEGWVIEIDGNPVETHVTHFGFLGTEIPTGNHEVHVYFE